MPRIPQYDEPQVQLKPFQRGATMLPSAGAVGAGAGDAAALAKGLDAFGDSTDRIAVQMANEEAFNVEAKVKQAWIEQSAVFQKERQGSNAKGVTEDVNKWWAETGSKMAEGTTTGRSQRMVQQSIQRLQLSAANEFKGFELRQGEIAADAAAEATVKSSISSVAANPSPDNMALHRNGIKAAIIAHAAARGWPPEVVNEKLSTANSAATIAAFNTIMARNPMEAQTFWAANRETVKGEMRDEIETRLKSGVAAQEGGLAAREVFTAATAGKPYTAAIMADELDAQLVKRFEGNPEGLKAARVELDRQVGLRNKAQTEQSAAAIEGVMGVWNKTRSLGAIKASADWAKLPETQRARVEEHIISTQTAEINRAEAASRRDITRMQRIDMEQRLRYAPAMVVMQQPEVLSKMTRAEIINMMPEIGAANTEQMLKTWSAWQGDQAKLSQAKIDNDLFKTALSVAGIDPAPPSKDKEGAYKVWALRAEVESRISSAQRTKGKELTDLEKREVMERTVGEKVLTPAWFGLSSSENIAATLTPEELATASVSIPVTVGPNAVPSTKTIALKSIPPAEYKKVEDSLRRAGRDPSPANVASQWWAFKNKDAK